MGPSRSIATMRRDGPMGSGEIAAAFDLAWPSITGHLNALKEAGLVDAERDGTAIRYRLNISAAEEAVGFLMELMGAGEPKPAPVQERTSP